MKLPRAAADRITMKLNRPAFLVTIDTGGVDLGSRPAPHHDPQFRMAAPLSEYVRGVWPGAHVPGELRDGLLPGLPAVWAGSRAAGYGGNRDAPARLELAAVGASDGR